MRSGPSQKALDQMRGVLSYTLGYVPPPGLRGTQKMRTGLELVLADQVVGLRRGEVLLMCQDLGYVDLMRYLLQRMWARDVED